MARKRMVTRTIKTTTATVRCADMENEKLFTQSILLPQTYKTEKDVLEMCRKLNPAKDNVAILMVVNTVINEHLYGVSEEEFLNIAHIMDVNEADGEEA